MRKVDGPLVMLSTGCFLPRMTKEQPMPDAQDQTRTLRLQSRGMSLAAREAGPADGPLIVLIAGWPETLHAWRLVQPRLADAGYRSIAIDPPGIGKSDLLQDGIAADTGGMADLISEALNMAGITRYVLVGHDVGTWISYALATRHPETIERVVLTEAAIPGVAPPEAFGIANAPRVFQFFLGATPDLPELLTEGREAIFFKYLFDTKMTVRSAIGKKDFDRYVEAYSAPGRMSAGFSYYRAAVISAQQNEERGAPSMPVLAIGGDGSLGDAVHKALVRKGTPDLRGQVLTGVGHYLPEEAPDEFVEAVLAFVNNGGNEQA